MTTKPNAKFKKQQVSYSYSYLHAQKNLPPTLRKKKKKNVLDFETIFHIEIASKFQKELL